MRESGFDQYYDEAVEPGKRERAYAWATAIGLQDVDGLKPSNHLLATACIVRARFPEISVVFLNGEMCYNTTMSRWFNIGWPCNAAENYMLPATASPSTSCSDHFGSV